MCGTILSGKLPMLLKQPLKTQTCMPWGYFRHCSLEVVKETKGNYFDALEPTQEDFSEITPYFEKSYNLAAYINRSQTLQNLVNLNVNLSKIEKKPFIVDKMLRLDFERDMKNHIILISDYIGMEQIGEFITRNPLIFFEELEDLKVRINYLASKGFKQSQINRIMSINPFWLMFSTVRIDRRLGYFQESFDLNGNDIRHLATRQPKLITYNLHSIRTNSFSIREEMGFEPSEMKRILLNKPKVFMLNQRALLERFNLLHNTMQVPHKTIVEHPEALLSRAYRIKQRHQFLEKLGRAQYNPKKENYVPLTALFEDSDVEFCKSYAKSNIGDFNLFLKTL